MEENKESTPMQPAPQPQPVKQEVKHEVRKEKGPSIFSRLKDKLAQYRRTIEIARKPDKAEYLSSLRIITIGMAMIGIVGFVMFLIFQVPKI